MRDLLLLCNRPANGANAETIIDHLDAFRLFPGFRIFELSTLGAIPDSLSLDRFDAIGIHYTLHLSDPGDYYLGRPAMKRIASFKGLKCAWLHDEYRHVNAVAMKLRAMGVDVIFSLASPPVIDVLYPKSGLPYTRLETVLAGYVPQHWTSGLLVPYSERPIDVGYRARRPPMWLGKLGQDKIVIGLGFIEATRGKGLNLDISVEEHDRFYGKEWQSFLGRCKTVLCVESGASVVDFSGNVEFAVERALKEKRHLSFEDVSVAHLQEIDGRYVINPVSPRIFEAASMRTVMIAFEGDYSGLMHPWEHYVPLRKDFSNIAEVLATIRDGDRLAKIAENAYRDLVAVHEHTFQAFADRCASDHGGRDTATQ